MVWGVCLFEFVGLVSGVIDHLVSFCPRLIEGEVRGHLLDILVGMNDLNQKSINSYVWQGVRVSLSSHF